MNRFLMVLLAVSALSAEARDCFQVESGKVDFTILQMGAPFSGEFTEFGGELCMEGDTVETVSVWLRPASIDTGLPDLDAALQGAELFHSEEFDRAAYRSTKVLRRDGRYVSHGKLTMKGIDEPLSVTFDLAREGALARVSGESELNRLEFAVGSGEWADTDLLSDQVRVEFSVVLGGVR